MSTYHKSKSNGFVQKNGSPFDSLIFVVITRPVLIKGMEKSIADSLALFIAKFIVATSIFWNMMSVVSGLAVSQLIELL